MKTKLHIQIQGVIWKSEAYNQSVKLRYRLFREPFGLDCSEQELKQEKDEKFFGAFLNTRLVGFCACRKLSETEYQIRHMVVEPKFQKQGVGALLVKACENYLYESNVQTVVLDSREESVGFYKKLGYKIEGEKFFKKTVNHWKMIKQLKCN